MAKALLGGVGRVDHRLVADVRRLQQRVLDLEAQLVHLQAENETLLAAASRADLVVLPSRKEPALA